MTTQTYSAQIASIQRRSEGLQQQISAHEAQIAACKTPAQLLGAFLRSDRRQQALRECSQSRERIAQLTCELAEMQAKKQELEQLQARFPDHDSLIQETEELRIRALRLEIEDKKVVLEKRETKAALRMAERLEEEKLRKESEALTQLQEDLIRQQEELTHKQAELKKRKASLMKRVPA